MSSKSYRSLCTEFYDLDKPTAPQDALEYYLEQAKRADGPLLEPMCGSGRFLVPIASSGFNIAGFDNSRHMLALCKDKCRKTALQCQLVNGAFEDFKTQTKFGLIFIPSGSFSLLTCQNDVTRALDYTREWLEEGGRFIFEIETIEAADNSAGAWKARWVRKFDKSLIVLNHATQFNPQASIETVLCRYEHWKKNAITRTEVEEFSLKRYTPSDIEALLSLHGFTVEKKVFSPFEESSSCMLYECVNRF